MVIRSIGVWSAARLYAAISAAMGILIGVVFALFSLAGAATGMNENAGILAGVFGVGAIVIFPIFYGVMGLIGGALGALLYNLFAGMVGGLEVDAQ
jgi:hypothetical protein